MLAIWLIWIWCWFQKYTFFNPVPNHIPVLGKLYILKLSTLLYSNSSEIIKNCSEILLVCIFQCKNSCQVQVGRASIQRKLPEESDSLRKPTLNVGKVHILQNSKNFLRFRRNKTKKLRNIDNYGKHTVQIVYKVDRKFYSDQNCWKVQFFNFYIFYSPPR